MNTATLPTGSMAFELTQQAPLHQRLWDSFLNAKARHAVAELRRQAHQRAGNPVLARQMLSTANSISVK